MRSYDVCNGVCNCHDCSDELNCSESYCNFNSTFICTYIMYVHTV